MKEKKKEMSIVKKMLIALVGGLVVGIACLFLREYLVNSGNEGVWMSSICYSSRISLRKME